MQANTYEKNDTNQWVSYKRSFNFSRSLFKSGKMDLVVLDNIYSVMTMYHWGILFYENVITL